MGFYNEVNCDLMKSMNIINMLTTYFVYNKRGLLFAIPHTGVCISSWLFWRNIENEQLRILDYISVANSMYFTHYQSFIVEKETIVTQMLIGVFYTFFLSNYFKNKKNQDYCIYFHTLTYVIGNLGIIYTFA